MGVGNGAVHSGQGPPTPMSDEAHPPQTCSQAGLIETGSSLRLWVPQAQESSVKDSSTGSKHNREGPSNTQGKASHLKRCCRETTRRHQRHSALAWWRAGGCHSDEQECGEELGEKEEEKEPPATSRRADTNDSLQ